MTTVSTEPSTCGREIIDAGFAHALSYLRRGFSSDARELKRRLASGDAACHDRLRYAAAVCAARIISEHDETVKRIYLVEEDPLGELSAAARVTCPIVLVVHVEHKTAALQSLLQAIDAESAAEYARRLDPQARGLQTFLQASMVDDDDVSRARGYASLAARRGQYRPLCLFAKVRRA